MLGNSRLCPPVYLVCTLSIWSQSARTAAAAGCSCVGCICALARLMPILVTNSPCDSSRSLNPALTACMSIACATVLLCFMHDRYCSQDDTRKAEEWIPRGSCHSWYHRTCAEIVGVLDDDQGFLCASCIS